MRSSGRLNSIGGGSVSFFNELDTDNEPCSWVSVSFFNELDTEKNYAHRLFHFLMSLTQEKNYARNPYFIF
jgi:hypothetical protein